MRKISKLSLVAAVAVAGFSTANAQPLEEAIKNVEVSGSVVYRYNDSNNDSNDAVSTGEGSTTNNNYKIGLNATSKVNDYVKFNSRFLVANEGSADFAGPLNTQTSGDTTVDVELSHAYFSLTAVPNTTVNVGKQGLTTPWTVALDSDGNEQTGTGVLALSTFGPVTAGAGYFNQTNLDKSGDFAGLFDGAEDIIVGAVIADLDPVKLEAWYLDMDNRFDTYSLSATSDFKFDGGKVGLEARYVSLDLDKQLDPEDTDNATAILIATGNIGIVNAKVAYAWTDKEGGITALDRDAKNTLLGWSINSLGKADADYWQAVLGVNILDNLNLSANYGNIEYVVGNADVEEEEIYAQLTYKMSKNLNTYVRYGTYTREFDKQPVVGSGKDINDDVRGRLQVEYTF
ncbi:major outer membrane protein [Arcobacter lacus]|uniref:major outer membrane protein n=1 Tax=Arcobacter lacus TaxID=1912876 RepID=UPI0021BA873B|nr:major outer membrane protein [Arcobacter lacus]MCT7909389.1 major outer membrane protein [Arcobacter lacus]MCT7910978.1 major outer membrane protein [Arcobacter lacus]